MRYKLLFILVLNINFNIFSQKNILFIAVDDLKPMFNSYGYNNIITPNIDALAAKGTLFSNASNQQSNFSLKKKTTAKITWQAPLPEGRNATVIFVCLPKARDAKRNLRRHPHPSPRTS